MSQLVGKADLPDLSFPRVSGDEPATDGMRAGMSSFSPRERG